MYINNVKGGQSLKGGKVEHIVYYVCMVQYVNIPSRDWKLHTTALCQSLSNYESTARPPDNTIFIALDLLWSCMKQGKHSWCCDLHHHIHMIYCIYLEKLHSLLKSYTTWTQTCGLYIIQATWVYAHFLMLLPLARM